MAEDVKAEEDVQEFVLISNSELRFELESKTEKVFLRLKEGLAELFGTELALGKSYEFRCGAKVAIYSWKGCKLELRGKPDVAYIAKETPMTMYLNCHAALEQMRQNAEESDKKGPVCMVVGPGDVGKSTLTKILCNYAVRMGRRPVFVDLDVGQGSIGMPGSIGAMLVERPAAIEGGFSQQAPLVYHFGHTSPETNIPLFNTLVSKLADVVGEKLEANKKANASGVIINTCGWIRNAGYKLLLHIAQAFEVDAILVLDQERLYNELQRDLPSFINLVLLPKSRGVVERSRQNRAENRDNRINEYFYGMTHTPLYPHSFEVRLSDVKIYKIGASALPDSCLPVGMKPEDNLTKLVPVTAGNNLINHILAVSFAASTEEPVIQTNVAGFVCVTKMDTEKGVMTVVSPQPRPLPETLLLLSEVQFVDSHA